MAIISNLVDKACLDAELAIVRAECCKSYKDCNNNDIADGANVATCANVNASITQAMQTTASDCNGTVLNLQTQQIVSCENLNTAIANVMLTNCQNQQVPISTPVATCTDIAALQAIITSLTNRITILEQKLSNPTDITDCNNNVLGTVYAV